MWPTVWSQELRFQSYFFLTTFVCLALLQILFSPVFNWLYTFQAYSGVFTVEMNSSELGEGGWVRGEEAGDPQPQLRSPQAFICTSHDPRATKESRHQDQTANKYSAKGQTDLKSKVKVHAFFLSFHLRFSKIRFNRVHRLRANSVTEKV